jgi:hypothetical protein
MHDIKHTTEQQMTDRELLELAAKAAGYQVVFDEFGEARLDGDIWIPIDDDGDALRLAVKLQLQVLPPEDEFGLNRASVRIAGRRYLIDAHDPDPCAATRRAIVHAAAEIGSKL